MTIRDVLRRIVQEDQSPDRASDAETEVRLAVYDSPLAAPRVVSLTAEDFDSFIGELTTQTYNHSRERGGRIPFVVIREVVENLIHGYFRNAVITVLDNGNTIRISDQGPGIRDKDKAIQPGFTTATQEMRRHIRGVGSGLPVAKEQLAFLGGTLLLEDNLDRGTVVTLALARELSPSGEGGSSKLHQLELSPRQKKVLLLIGELGATGPSTIAQELKCSQSTAYRELQALQDLGLVQDKGAGKRTLTEAGVVSLDEIFAS